MAQKRTELIQVRLTPVERQNLKYAAEKSNMSMSDMMRLFTFVFIADILEGRASDTMAVLRALRLLPVIPRIMSNEEAAAARAEADE